MRKKVAVVLATALVLMASVGVYASTGSVYGNLFGVSEEEAYDLAREEGKTLMQLADENGKLDEYKDAVIEDKAADLQEAVDEGRITQERADYMIEHMTERITEADPDDFGYGAGNGCGVMMGGRGGFGEKGGYGNQDGLGIQDGLGTQSRMGGRAGGQGGFGGLGYNGDCPAL